MVTRANSERSLKYLRRMTIEDIPGVMMGESQSYSHPWTEGIFTDCLKVNHYSCWVLELDDSIINETDENIHKATNEEIDTRTDKKLKGHIVISAAAGEAHILNLCVYPDMQGKGWGRKLLTEAEWIAKQHRAETCFLEVRPSNLAGMHLYHDMGYNEIGTRKDYYPADKGREDAIVMAKTLF